MRTSEQLPEQLPNNIGTTSDSVPSNFCTAQSARTMPNLRAFPSERLQPDHLWTSLYIFVLADTISNSESWFGDSAYCGAAFRNISRGIQICRGWLSARLAQMAPPWWLTDWCARDLWTTLRHANNLWLSVHLMLLIKPKDQLWWLGFAPLLLRAAGQTHTHTNTHHAHHAFADCKGRRVKGTKHGLTSLCAFGLRHLSSSNHDDCSCGNFKMLTRGSCCKRRHWCLANQQWITNHIVSEVVKFAPRVFVRAPTLWPYRQSTMVRESYSYRPSSDTFHIARYL